MARRTIKGPVGRGSISLSKVIEDATALREERSKHGRRAAKASASDFEAGKRFRASGPLVAIVGSQPIPRTEVTKKIWAYIKKNKLQDAVDKRKVHPDSALRAVFGPSHSLSNHDIARVISQRYRAK